jgi:SOS-response transcriptional repressor LexA
MPELLDVKDILVLRMVKQGSSIREMASAIGVSSSNTAHKRLKKLIERGFVTPPPTEKMARSWKLTSEGEKVIAPYATAV